MSNTCAFVTHGMSRTDTHGLCFLGGGVDGLRVRECESDGRGCKEKETPVSMT